MAYRILQVEGRFLSCQSKPNDNKRLQKKKNMQWFYKFGLCMQIFRGNFYEPLRADVSKYRPEVYKSEKSKILKKIHKVALGKLLT